MSLSLNREPPDQLAWASRLIPGVIAPGQRKQPQFENYVPGSWRKRQGRSVGVSRTGPALSHLLRQWCEQAGAPFTGSRNVLVVGSNGVARRTAAYLQTHPETHRIFCGFLDDAKGSDPRIVGRTSELAKLARAGFVDEVILAAPHDRNLTDRLLRMARQLHLDVSVVPDLFGCTPQGSVEFAGDVPMIVLHKERLPVAGLLIKRAIDILGAATMLVALSPVFALLALLIKLDSKGPVLYVAQRAGKKGRPFRFYKFRTMTKNAESLKKQLRLCNERSGPFFKIKNDPRVTRLGNFLRRYSLDELPQLWNVLRGEMSLVGPRPHPLDDFSDYSIEHLSRLDMTPGMTGLWQVTARRDPSFRTGVELDNEYIRSWSLALDLKILLKTLGAVWQGSGD